MAVSHLRLLVSVLLPSAIALWGLRRKSLSSSGALLALMVGFMVTLSNGCLCAAMMAFFFSSSRLTKWKGHIKRKMEHDYKEGGQRDWAQVVCNGSVLCVAAILYAMEGGIGESSLVFDSASPHWATLYLLAGLAAVACCCGDTWASEVGTVIGGEPRLITSGRKVPKGTNGGVTLTGIVVSLAGGLLVGVAFYCAELLLSSSSEQSIGHQNSMQWIAIIIGGVAGVYGSAVDSILGATLQFSGYCTQSKRIVSEPGLNVRHISGVSVLSNNMVNLLSSLITSVTIPVLLYLMWDHLQLPMNIQSLGKKHWYVI